MSLNPEATNLLTVTSFLLLIHSRHVPSLAVLWCSAMWPIKPQGTNKVFCKRFIWSTRNSVKKLFDTFICYGGCHPVL